MGTQTIPTGVYGPLPEGTIGLILGKNSLTLKGLQIHPGVIDQDYMGKLKILAQTPQTFVAIAPTDKIAHLIIFPNVRVGKVPRTPHREKKCLVILIMLIGYSKSLLTAPRWHYF
jgi:dUTPase